MSPTDILTLGHDLRAANHLLRTAEAAADRCPSAYALQRVDEARVVRDRLLDAWPQQRDPSN